MPVDEVKMTGLQVAVIIVNKNIWHYVLNLNIFDNVSDSPNSLKYFLPYLLSFTRLCKFGKFINNTSIGRVHIFGSVKCIVRTLLLRHVHDRKSDTGVSTKGFKNQK